MARHEQDLLFVENPTDEDFTVIWGGRPYTVKPNQKQIFPRFVAEHFAKHLADKILLKKEADLKAQGGKNVNLLNSATERPAVVNSIITGTYSEFTHDTKTTDPNAITAAQIEQLNAQPQQEEKAMDIGEVEENKALGVMKQPTAPPLETEIPQNHTLDEAVKAPEDTTNTPVVAGKPKRTKKQLIEEAETLGVDLKGSETVEQLEAIIKAF